MPETLTITGSCTEISEKNGWTAFAIDAGGQWPVKLSTKKEEVIATARGVGGEIAVWTYNEVESDKINEHTGKPFLNRYLYDVEVGGPTHVPPQGWEQAEKDAAPRPTAQAAVTATHSPLPPGDKDRAITRMAVLKAAAEVCANPANVSPDGDVAAEVIAMAARFETWVYRDVDDIPF
jgi:hypothetical protein